MSTTTRKRLTTRGIRTATAIRDMVPFTTSGSLSAQAVPGLGTWDSGRLSGADETAFRAECREIRYVVYSYSTPIAWWSGVNGWHVVSQKFSSTTSKHQGNLYMVTHHDIG